MDINTLLSSASCFNCYLGVGPLLELALLDRIAGSIGPPTPDEGILTEPEHDTITTEGGDVIVPD